MEIPIPAKRWGAHASFRALPAKFNFFHFFARWNFVRSNTSHHTAQHATEACLASPLHQKKKGDPSRSSQKFISYSNPTLTAIQNRVFVFTFFSPQYKIPSLLFVSIFSTQSRLAIFQVASLAGSLEIRRRLSNCANPPKWLGPKNGPEKCRTINSCHQCAVRAVL